jgi:hypothetical protein
MLIKIFLLNKCQTSELIVDSDTCLPIEYYIYDENENIMFGITYEKFDISSKVDEKIFQK